MAISLSITVADITATLSAGYTHIRVYRSANQTTGFYEITSSSSMILLQAGVSTYSFIDAGGTTENWYYTTLYALGGTPAESSPSTAFMGNYYDPRFTARSYPEDGVYTSNDRYVIDRIRNLTGDPKQLTRDYISSSTGYSSISLDGTTYSLDNPRGWPLLVKLDGVEYTDSSEPVVNDYQFLTFSGTTVNTTSGTLDVWYYHFRNSDPEILRVYNGLNPPPPLDAEDVTFELAAVCAAIELLEAELRLFGVTSGSEVDIFQEIRINPKGGFDGRVSDLEALRKYKKELIAAILSEMDSINSSDISGVLID